MNLQMINTQLTARPSIVNLTARPSNINLTAQPSIRNERDA
jgi:hypothetical protein